MKCVQICLDVTVTLEVTVTLTHTFYPCAKEEAVPSTFSQFAAWPTDVQVRHDPEYLPGYNFVQYLPDGQTIVHQHTFPV